MKLNQKNIENLEYSNKRYYKQVGEPKELYIKVTSKNKIFALLLSNNGKRNFYSIGTFNKLNFNLQSAKIKANKLIQDYKIHGKFPNAKKEKEETLKNLYNNWLNLKKKRVSPQTIIKDNLRVEKHILPIWSDKPYSYFNTLQFREELIKYLQELNKGDITYRILGLFKEILNPLVVLGKLDYNPINVIKDNYNNFFVIHKSKNYPYLSEEKDIKNLIIGIKNYNGEQIKYALYVVLLSALRSTNIRNLRWEDINFKDRIISIESTRMKSKRKFTFPISNKLLYILQQWHRKEQEPTNGKVFKGIRTNRGLSENALNNSLRFIGFTKEQMVAHGFRSMFRTITGDNIKKIDTTQDILEKCLDHKLLFSAVQGHYDHSKNIEDMRVVFNWWANYLNKIEPLL